jgi:hypothetical protein
MVGEILVMVAPKYFSELKDKENAMIKLQDGHEVNVGDYVLHNIKEGDRVTQRRIGRFESIYEGKMNIRYLSSNDLATVPVNEISSAGPEVVANYFKGRGKKELLEEAERLNEELSKHGVKLQVLGADVVNEPHTPSGNVGDKEKPQPATAGQPQKEEKKLEQQEFEKGKTEERKQIDKDAKAEEDKRPKNEEEALRNKAEQERRDKDPALQSANKIAQDSGKQNVDKK